MLTLPQSAAFRSTYVRDHTEATPSEKGGAEIGDDEDYEEEMLVKGGV